ncbi:MAG: hypothetical protein Q8O19_07790, partial [Rectinemataceae bacterium]|nr:hypothetical protein [Rectinemataceae bacterium]
THYPPLGSFWGETGMRAFPISGNTNSAIAAALVANKDNSHLFQAGMWKKHASWDGSINILYQKYSTVMEVKKPLGDGKLGEKVKVLLSFSGMTYERFTDSPPVDLNLVKYKGEKPFSVDPATGSAAYLVEVQRGEGFVIAGSDFKWPDFTKPTVTRDPVDPNKTTLKTETRGRFSFDGIHNEEIKVELKVTHPQNPGPTGSAAKYSNTPNAGSADNLFSTWLNEQFRVNVNIQPAALANNLPVGFIKWTAAGFTIPDNTTEYVFSWDSTGIKEITVEFPSCGITKKIHVDVPSVGIFSQTAAAALVPPIVAALIVSYAQEAIDYSTKNFPVGPQRDAFRHAYWMSLSVSHLGIVQWHASLISTGHEHDNRDTDHQQAFNSTMDLHNNAVGVTINHTTLLGMPDRTPIQNDITKQYTNGGLWIWAGGGAQEKSEGILVKSDGSKIYPK